jgi:hypothetical protein
MISRIFDIFFSYNYQDKAAVEKALDELKTLDYSVYVDWIEDAQWDRSAVTRNTVDGLRKRMRQCRCLFFGVSSNSKASKWTPWELGYMDGYRGKVFVFPLADDVIEGNTGQEYLDAYPLVDRSKLAEFLRTNLPKGGNPVFENPIFPPADIQRTEGYGDWMDANAFRITTDPTSYVKFWTDIWQAYYRLWMRLSMS